MSGERAQIGVGVQRAIGLVDATGVDVRVFDTEGTADGARAAVRQASGFGADVIVGPASAGETRAVQGAVKAPILTLSNDDRLQGDGVFVMGVTAAQSAGAVLAYARRAGVRTVAIVGPPTDWRQGCEAAARAQAANGVDVTAVLDSPAGDLVTALAERPNAVLIAESDAMLGRLTAELGAASIQVLGTSQWSVADVAVPSAAGAWIAAPDPRWAARFVEAHQRNYGAAPGMISGLAHDAMALAVNLIRAGRMTRADLLRPDGFGGVIGPCRFTFEQKPQRRLAILVAAPEGARSIAEEPQPWA